MAACRGDALIQGAGLQNASTAANPEVRVSEVRAQVVE